MRSILRISLAHNRRRYEVFTDDGVDNDPSDAVTMILTRLKADMLEHFSGKTELRSPAWDARWDGFDPKDVEVEDLFERFEDYGGKVEVLDLDHMFVTDEVGS